MPSIATLTPQIVTVAGVTVTKQYFSPVTTLSSSFADDPIDGLLGLAYPAISNLNQVNAILAHIHA